MRVTSVNKRLQLVAVLVLICFFSILAIDAFATEVTVLNGQVSITDTANRNTASSGTVTIQAKGSLFGKQTNTITIKNETDVTAIIGFAYTADTYNSFTIAGNAAPASGTYSSKLASGGTITISIQSNSGAKNTTATLKLSGFSYQAVAASSVVTATFESTRGTVKFAGNTVASGDSVTVSGGELGVEASPKTGYTFLGWVNSGTNALMSTDEKTTLDISENTNIQALFISSCDTAWFLAGTNIYNDLTLAVNHAKTLQRKIVVLMNNGTLSEGNYTISDGVTLLIPFDPDYTVVDDPSYNSGSYLSPNYEYLLNAYDPTATTRSQYRVMTMEADANITVAANSAINIGSKLANQFIGQVGPYGAVKMDEGSNITVQSGGFLYAWGYIFYGEGKGGTVTVESGGTVYEPMSIMDYPGSGDLTNTLVSNKVFPMRAYAARNVEVPMTLNSGAKEYAFSCLYGSTVGTHPLNVLFIANTTVNGETPVFQNSGTITKSFENGRMYLTSNGDITLNSLAVEVNAGGIKKSINSGDTSGFYIPSGYDMALASGTITLVNDVIMCEGSKLTIASGATLNTNGKNIYVFDADDDVGAVGDAAGLGETTIGGGWNGCSLSVQDVHGDYYTFVPEDAVLDINGTVLASGGFYTSNAKAFITSSMGGGVIKITGTSSQMDLKYKNNSNSYDTKTFYPAYLANANGTYVSSTLRSAFIYDLPTGRWLCYDADNKTYAHPDTTGYCSICGAYLGEESALSKFYATNVNLGNDLDMLFAFPVTTGASYAVFTREGHDPIIVEIDTTKTVKIGTVECYYVSYSGFAAKEMCDTVYVHLYDSSNNRITECKNDGIRKYAMRMLEKLASEDDEASKYLKRVIVDMLDYGTACQTYFGYKTTDMANKDLTDVQRAYTSETLPTVTGTTIANSYWNGSNLITSSNIQLAMAFKNVTGEMYVQFSYKGHKGNSVTSEKLYPQNTADGYITVPELVVADSRCPVTVTVYNADGTVVASWTESIESYVGRNAADDPVFLAFMKFSDSAKVYLHNKNS